MTIIRVHIGSQWHILETPHIQAHDRLPVRTSSITMDLFVDFKFRKSALFYLRTANQSTDIVGARLEEETLLLFDADSVQQRLTGDGASALGTGWLQLCVWAYDP